MTARRDDVRRLVAIRFSLATAAFAGGRVSSLPLPPDTYGRLVLSGNGERIVLYRPDGSLWISSRYGEGLRRVLAGPIGSFDVDYSGELVCAEVLDQVHGTHDIVAVNTVTGGQVTIAHDQSGAGVHLSGDGRTVAYRHVTTQTESYELRVTDDSLPAEPFPDEAQWLAISYDGTRIAYTRDTGGVMQVWGAERTTPTGWNLHQVTEETQGVANLVIAGDGSTIVYASSGLRSNSWDGTNPLTLPLLGFAGPLSFDGSLVCVEEYLPGGVLRPVVARTDGSASAIVRVPRGLIGNLPTMDAFGTTVLFGVHRPFEEDAITVMLEESSLTVEGNPVPGATLTLRII
jgi:WD40 repeat protein